MSWNKAISRRRFLGSASAGALGVVYIPGVGRVKADEYPLDATDYQGRLCYNENPLGPSPLAQDAMKQAAEMAHRYPDWYNQTLESRIAEFHGLQAANICIGAGATELLRLIADVFLGPGDEMITAEPTYFQMASEAAANGTTVVYVPVDGNHVIDLETMLESVNSRTKLISLVNPNNPVGTIVDKSAMADFVDALPDDIIVLVDEAYHHYIESDRYESCIRHINEGRPVIVVRTFSKVFGMAGARVGYTIASVAHTGMIAASQLFATVSRPSQEGAAAALYDYRHTNDTVSLNAQARAFLEQSFTEMGLDFIPSETNFMMFDTGMNASWVASQLGQHGYEVRTGWGMPQHIRVSTGLIEEMQGFINALRDILHVGVNEIPSLPGVFALNTIYPNPFNSECTIKLTVGTGEKVNVSIYDVWGRRVRNLVNGPLKPGINNLKWDGKNYSGQKVASGAYIINAVQGEFAHSRKITLIK